MNHTDKTLAILQGSHDGNDLAPEHLKLVEWAANNCLNERGWRRLMSYTPVFRREPIENPHILTWSL